MPLRQRHDALPQLLVAIRPRRIAIRVGAHPHHRQRPPLAESSLDHLPHRVASIECGQNFFRSASRVTSVSSIGSACRFFSRAFSVSSSRGRLASDTFIPPNLLRHR